MKNPEQNSDSDAARAMQEVVGAWVAQDRRPVSAAERLKKIRATAPAAARKTSKWPAFAVAACVALMLGTGWIYTRQNRTPASEAGGVRNNTQAATTKDPAPAPVAATLIDAGAKGLFRCPKVAPGTWTMVTEQNPVRVGDYLQSTATINIDLKLATAKRLSVHPGTILALNDSGGFRGLLVELWRGRISVEPSAKLDIGYYSPSGELQFCSASPGGSVSLYTVGFEIGVAGNSELADLRTLKPDAGSVTEPRVAEPETHLDDAAANLLKTIKFEFKDTPATDALNTLRDLLGVKMSFSTMAAEKVAAKKVTMSFTEISGAEALAKFAEQLGLELTIRKGEVVFELPGEKGAMLPPAPESNDAF